MCSNKGGGGSGGAKIVSQMKSRISNPQTKQDFIDRLQVMVELGSGGYKVNASIRDWTNYGKSRTYLKVNAYRGSDGKFHHSQDYGYYDNVAQKYVKSSSHNLDGTFFDLDGSKVSDAELDSAIKSYLAKSKP